MKNFVILLFTILIAPTIHAETMQGGTYTLNGSVDVMVNQGTGGTYTLNPNGDSMSTNSSGGTYTLYPTPYLGSSSTTTPPATGEVIAAVTQSVSYGTQDNPRVAVATSSTSTQAQPTNPQNPRGPNNEEIITRPDGTTGYYDEEGEFIPVDPGTNYGYPTTTATDTVNFGKGTSTEQNPMAEGGSNLLMRSIWIILIIFILIIIRKLIKKVRGDI